MGRFVVSRHRRRSGNPAGVALLPEAVVSPLCTGRARGDVWPMDCMQADGEEPGDGGGFNVGYGEGGHAASVSVVAGLGIANSSTSSIRSKITWKC